MTSQKLNVKQIPKENRNQKVWSRRAYVDWVNKILKAHYTDANEFRNGALYVQLLDSLFPGAIPLDEVKFCAQKGYDCYQNFCILDEAFKKLGINRTLNVHALSEGRHVASWEFLKWFKEFYDKNFVENDYDPLKARKNAYMGYGKSRNTRKSDAMKSACEKPNVGSQSRSNTLKRNISKDKSENVEENVVKEKNPSQSMDSTSEKVKAIFKESKIEENSSKSNKLGQSSSTNSIKTLTETANMAEESNALLTSIGSSSRNRTTGKNAQSLRPLDNGISKHCHIIIPTSATKISTGGETKSKESTKSSSKDVIKYVYAHGDFERKYARKTMSEGSNVHSIVFDKTASYDEFKINISDNIQIRFEDIKNAAMKKSLVDAETRRKINVMVENFLEFQWVERKDYLDSIVEFLRRRRGEKI